MKKNILAVDDEVEIPGILKTILESEGHKVTVANSGDAAILVMKENNFDIIISDFHMKNGNGMKVLEFANTLKKKPHFFFFSAAHSDIEKECLNKGALRFFQKPFSPIQLCHEIQKTISEFIFPSTS